LIDLTKTIIVLLFPVLVFIWAIVWTLFNLGPSEVRKVLFDESEDDETDDDFDDDDDDE
jgi:hypothetical protein